MDRVVAKEVAAVYPVHPHAEEPYNENKPITAAAQINTINSFFSSWFKGAAAESPDNENSKPTPIAPSAASDKHVTSVSAPTRSESNERAAAEIIAASLAVNSSSAVSEATVLIPVTRGANKTQNNSKMAARLEAMRSKKQ